MLKKGKMTNYIFNQRSPHVLVVDNFYKDPDAIVEMANSQEFKENNKLYKGKRSSKCLLPYVREEFERLLNVEITDWLNQPMNGVFQITNSDHPLVWHSDSQSYAAAIYLTKGESVGHGTSFWREKNYDCRRPPEHPLENKIDVKGSDVYSEFNLLNPDNWELVDRVGSVYNRLVLWDAKLIHSATKYGNFERLVQLFFFSAQEKVSNLNHHRYSTF